MRYKDKYFSFLSIGILMLSLSLAGCSKDEILDQYNNVVQSAGNAALTSDFSLKGNRTYGEELVPEYLIHILDLSSFQHFEYFKTELEPFFSLYQKRNRKKFVEY